MSKKEYVESCKYNTFVGCNEEGRKCDKCGWCPVVSDKRLKKIRKELGVKE